MASGSGGGCGRSVIGLLLLVPAPADVNSAVGLRRGRSWLVHGWTRLWRAWWRGGSANDEVGKK